MANRRFTQFYSTLHSKPVQLDCIFTVTPSNANGTTAVTGPGIAAVYMHTSTTPSAGNPNPSNGHVLVQFQDTYNGYYFGGAQFQSPNSGSSISISGSTVMTIGAPYTITAVGTTTTAQWVVAGVPVGIAPAVGVTFFAAITGGGTGTGTVQAPLATGSGILAVDVIGNPVTTLKSSAATVAGSSSGAYMVLRTLAATNSSTTTLVATAPATGSVCRLKFVLSNSFIVSGIGAGD